MALRIRIRARDEPALRPAEDFSAEFAPSGSWSSGDCTGPNAAAVRSRIARSTAGWRVRPTAPEFHAAIRADRPTGRQRALVETWAWEAAPREMLLAWLQHAYAWRTLVDAPHRHGQTRRGELNGYLNLFAS